jgi:hypothetical protein
MEVVTLPVEENIKNQITNLINRAQKLKVGDHEYNQAQSPIQIQECSGWLASALNIVQLVCPTPENAFRRKAENIANKEHGYVINEAVGEFACLLAELQRDIGNGLLASVADRARAETFDNFLDHAKEYLKENLKNEAGVIAGVVFEDSLRRVYRKNGKDDKGEKLDTLISYLAKNDIISQAKAKRARVAAHVRTKATHAQWDEFDNNDVQVTIDFTEELVLAHLDA